MQKPNWLVLRDKTTGWNSKIIYFPEVTLKFVKTFYIDEKEKDKNKKGHNHENTQSGKRNIMDFLIDDS